jgi:hypothetical protein
MYNIVAENYEKREHEIVEENAALKQFLLTLYKGLSHRMAQEKAFSTEIEAMVSFRI